MGLGFLGSLPCRVAIGALGSDPRWFRCHSARGCQGCGIPGIWTSDVGHWLPCLRSMCFVCVFLRYKYTDVQNGGVVHMKMEQLVPLTAPPFLGACERCWCAGRDRTPSPRARKTASTALGLHCAQQLGHLLGRWRPVSLAGKPRRFCLSYQG